MNLLELPEKSPYLFLLFLVALISVTTLSSSFLSIDDVDLIVNNPKLVVSLKEITAVFSSPLGHQLYDASDYQPKFIYYRPALIHLYIFNIAVWGTNPVGFHIINLLLHLLSAILIYRTGLLLFNSDKTVSLLGASLFCVHPVHNELIGRVAMNENLLGFFIALSLYFYLQDKKYHSMAAFAIALLSKESAVMLPFVFCLIEMRKQSFKRAIFSLKPFLILVDVYLAVRTIVMGVSQDVTVSSDFLGTLLTACSATADYFRLLLVPFPLNVYYPVLKAASVINQDLLVRAAICALLGVVFWKVRSDTLLLPLLSGAVIMLVPVIVKANELALGFDLAYIAERQLYVPSMFYSLFIAGILFKYTGPQVRKYAVTGMYLLLFLFSYTTASASVVWRNDASVNARFVQDFPGTSLSHQYKGEVLCAGGDFDRSLAEFNAAFPPSKASSSELVPDSFETRVVKSGSPGIHQVFHDVAKYHPVFAELHFKLGNVYLAKGDVDRAVREFKISLVLQPKSIPARAILADVYLKNGMRKDAQREFRIVMKQIMSDRLSR